MDTRKKIKFGVIGAGKIGNYHCRTLSQMEETELVAIADINHARAQKLGWKYNAMAYQDYKAIFPQVDAVIIAVPTEFHASTALEAIKKKKHVLIEKPITDSVEDAKLLLEASEKAGIVLQVGHVERFNSAVIETMKYIKKPKFVAIERLGPFDPRVAGIGVTLDLMIHDIDLVLAMIKSRIESFEAIGASLLSEHEDIANVRIRFKNGAVADITASRITLEKSRRMRVYQEDSYISVNYVSSLMKIYRKKNPVVKSLDDIEVVFPKIETKQPIKEEILHFIDCINNSKKPLASGERGLEALKLTLEITEALKKYELKQPNKLFSKNSLFQSLVDVGKVTRVFIEEKLKDSGIEKS